MSRWWWGIPPLALAATFGVMAWLRGPQPDLAPPPQGAVAAAEALLRAARVGVPPAVLPSGTWYLSAWPVDGADPVTVLASKPSWEVLGLAGEARLQVDLAVPDPPAAHTAFRGFGLDPGLDGWVETDGTVHLPMELQVRGMARRELAEFIDARPGAPLRTWSWVEGEDGHARRLRRGTVDPGRLTRARLVDRVDAGAGYLVRHLRADGRFDYEWDARTGRDLGGYNLLRHAGSLYAMFGAYEYTGDEAQYEAASRGLAYLQGHREVSQVDPARCLEVSGKVAKLGGSALTLLALVRQAEVRPEDADAAWMACLADHLISQVDADGQFASYASDGGRLDQKARRSLYYPGEALLALARYQGLRPDPEREAVVHRAALWMVRHQWRAWGLRLKVLPDAWLAQALELIHAQTGDEELAVHLFRLGHTLGARQLDSERVPVEYRGSNAQWGLPNVVSVGSTAEGFAAVARLERRLRPGQTTFYERLLASVRFALRNQYTAPMSLGLRRPELAWGGFRDSPITQEVRIDGVQHNISGIMGLIDLWEGAP